jgi:hypothetical protein
MWVSFKEIICMQRAIASAHSSFHDFLEHSPLGPEIRQALSVGEIIVVPPGEGSTQIQAHADIQGYLRGRTLSEAVENQPPVVSAPVVTQPSVHTTRRRPG